MCLDQQQKDCDADDHSACAGIVKADKFVETEMTYANAVFMIKTDHHQNVVYIE